MNKVNWLGSDKNIQYQRALRAREHKKELMELFENQFDEKNYKALEEVKKTGDRAKYADTMTRAIKHYNRQLLLNYLKDDEA